MKWTIGKGISPFIRSGGGTSWSSYWATLISATVEQAAPTNVVLTFPTAKTSLGASDFTIVGFIVISASWVGSVLTLVTLTPVLIFHGNLTITFVTTGQTATVTNNVLDDGNTVAQFDSTDLTTITKDAGTGEVSLWKDKLLSGHDLAQATATKYPIWSVNGILFDGSNDFMKCATFPLIQPTFIYAVVKQITYTINEYIWDGNGLNSGVLGTSDGPSPNIWAYAGSFSTEETQLTLDTYFIVRLLISGINSKLQIGDKVAKAAILGAATMAGFTLGASANGTACGNIEVKEIIIRKVADSISTETAIYNYLANKHGLDEIPLFRSFAGLTRYAGNPIIVHGTEAYNAFGTDAAYVNLNNKIGSTYYFVTQVSPVGFASWDDFVVYSSTDLINWTDHGIVLSNELGEWDDNYLTHPCVIKIGSVFYLYYSAISNAAVKSVGLATSTDFLAWTKHPSNPVYSGTGGNQAYAPCVIQIGSTFYMYYHNGLIGAGSKIEYATSPDGITWTYGGVAIPEALIGEWNYHANRNNIDPWVIKNSYGYYEMVFSFAATIQTIGYAVSFDGIKWYQYEKLIFQKAGVGWESYMIGDPVLVELADGTIYFYYAGISLTSVDGGLATIP